MGFQHDDDGTGSPYRPAIATANPPLRTSQPAGPRGRTSLNRGYPCTNATPHVSQNTNGRRSAIDRRTTRHPGYATSVRVRKRIEEVFGWIKTVGGLRKTRHHGTALVGWMFTLAAAAYNVVRIPKLLAVAT